MFFQVAGGLVDNDGLQGETEQEQKTSDACCQPVEVQNADDHRGYPGCVEYQAGQGLKTGQPALHPMIQPCCGGVTYFLFFPVLGTQKRLHAYNGIGIRFHPRVLRGSHVVDEQIVVSPLQVEVCGESFLLVEEFLPVGQVTPDAHVGAACQGKSQIAHGSEQIVECHPFVQPAFAAFVAAVSQHHLGT